MKRAETSKSLSFQSKLESISDEAKYFALSVPAKISRTLGVRGPVPVSARINGHTPFLVSLHPVGGGRHYMRVKAKVRQEAKIKEGDRVQVQIIVIDRESVAIPPDLASALREEGVLNEFKSLPPGKRSYIIRCIDEAARPQTREKRIQEAVEEAHRKRG